MKPADELWVQQVRQMDARGVPLIRRETTNALALDQTASLQVARTRSYHSLADSPTGPGLNECQRCGASLPHDGAADGWRVTRAVYRRGGVLRLYVCPACS